MPPATSPSGATLSIDTLSLRLNGVPILPIAGEMHPSRVPVSQWRSDLLKMRAGGLTIVSAYVMWLHTEEVRGVQDFSGNRNVSLFLDTAADVGLMVALRIGPWDHGECRNGGIPDWVLAACTGGCRQRDNNTQFLDLVRGWYAGLAAHVRGRGWAEGGPVISIQVDNETGNTNYLLALKALAVGLGMQPAFWVKTGWPSPSTPVPYGELAPLFGGYVDDFWGGPKDVSYGNFLFSDAPNPAPLPPKAATRRGGAGDSQSDAYPWLMVEMGGGMASSYHRRINVNADDHIAQAAVFLGSGAANLGFYSKFIERCLFSPLWCVCVCVCIVFSVCALRRFLPPFCRSAPFMPFLLSHTIQHSVPRRHGPPWQPVHHAGVPNHGLPQ